MSNSSGINITTDTLRTYVDSINSSSMKMQEIFNNINKIVERTTSNNVWDGLSKRKFVDKYNEFNKNFPKVIEKNNLYIEFLYKNVVNLYDSVNEAENKIIDDNGSNFNVLSNDLFGSVSSSSFDNNYSLNEDNLENVNNNDASASFIFDDIVGEHEDLHSLNNNDIWDLSFDDNYDENNVALNKLNSDELDSKEFTDEYDINNTIISKMNGDYQESYFDDEYDIDSESINNINSDLLNEDDKYDN